MSEELGLADAIEVVRKELIRAQNSGKGKDVRFSVGSVEVEFVVEVVKSGGAEASIKVLNLVSLGGEGSFSRGETNTVKVIMNPVSIDGQPFEVAASGGRRPDAEA